MSFKLNKTRSLPWVWSDPSVPWRQSPSVSIKFNSKSVINVSYKDIVDEMKIEDKDIYYVAKDGNKYSTNDIKYKNLVI